MTWTKIVPVLLRTALGLVGTACALAQAVPTAGPDFSGHAAWVYDSLNLPGKARQVQPGFFVAAINDYNSKAQRGHQIEAIYNYHGSMEMYCQNGPLQNCSADKLTLSFATPRGKSGRHATGSSVARYRQGLKNGDNQQRLKAIAIIDGVVNGQYEGSLKGFNELPQNLAEGFADKVTASICDDPNIDGVQFDLEPIDIETQNGQYFFYRRISENFAGDREIDGINCVTDSHPVGRFFSVFAPVRALRPGSDSAAHMHEITNAHRNGYMIAPIYDLDGSPLGHATPVGQYQQMALRQLQQLNEWASQAKVAFKVGIPAAASVHEYVRCEGPPCRNHRAAPDSQLAYVQAVINAQSESGIRDNTLFLGNAIWAWSRGISHGGARFLPESPPTEVLNYLAEHL
ncbi:hypothetical protein AB4876_10070 [Zhongshania guokunii]|uniref:Chitinase n=1 Tax=Zhongshania guokunii TaxID=641783 RepID=A0ABV3U5W3_9GAMM